MAAVARSLTFGSSSSSALSLATRATIAAPAALSFWRSQERRGLPKESAAGAVGEVAGGGSSVHPGGVSIVAKVWQVVLAGF